MRVLFIHAAPAWSGTARTISTLAGGLADRGWSTIVATAPGSPAHERFVADGHAAVPMDLRGTPLAAGRRLAAFIEQRFLEVVFVHGDREQMTASVAVRLAGRGAVIRRWRSGERPRAGLRSRLASRYAPTVHLYERGESAPASSRRLLASVDAVLGVNADAYDAIRPAPRAMVGAGGSSRLITCVYGPGRRGSASTLLRTVRLLAPRHPELRVAFVGERSDAEDLRMHAAALGLTRTIAFLGERDDAKSVIRAADVAWIVAEHDTAAWAYLDSMAMRVPILAERSAHAQRYVADGVGGLLLPPAESEATAATVTAFLSQDDRRAAMGAAGRARVAREFNERAMLDSVEAAAAAARERTAWTA